MHDGKIQGFVEIEFWNLEKNQKFYENLREKLRFDNSKQVKCHIIKRKICFFTNHYQFLVTNYPYSLKAFRNNK